jgi:hypothetical protein
MLLGLVLLLLVGVVPVVGGLVVGVATLGGLGALVLRALRPPAAPIPERIDRTPVAAGSE